MVLSKPPSQFFWKQEKKEPEVGSCRQWAALFFYGLSAVIIVASLFWFYRTDTIDELVIAPYGEMLANDPPRDIAKIVQSTKISFTSEWKNDGPDTKRGLTIAEAHINGSLEVNFIKPSDCKERLAEVIKNSFNGPVLWGNTQRPEWDGGVFQYTHAVKNYSQNSGGEASGGVLTVLEDATVHLTFRHGTFSGVMTLLVNGEVDGLDVKLERAWGDENDFCKKPVDMTECNNPIFFFEGGRQANSNMWSCELPPRNDQPPPPQNGEKPPKQKKTPTCFLPLPAEFTFSSASIIAGLQEGMTKACEDPESYKDSISIFANARQRSPPELASLILPLTFSVLGPVGAALSAWLYCCIPNDKKDTPEGNFELENPEQRY